MLQKVILSEQFSSAGLIVSAVATGKIVRPVSSIDPAEGYFGLKMYIAISKEFQLTLGITRPSDNIIAIPRSNEPHIVTLYVVSAIAPDNDWSHAGKSGPGFISRAKAGWHKNNDITTMEQAALIVKTEIAPDSIATADFRPSLLNTKLTFGIINRGLMRNQTITTALPIKNIDKGYPQRLQEKWNSAKRELEKINGKKYPLFVVPNAVANLLGLNMDSSLNQPGYLGPTITSGGLCKVTIDNKRIFEAFVVGALDSIGMPVKMRAKYYLPPGSDYLMNISVGSSKLNISRQTTHSHFEALGFYLSYLSHKAISMNRAFQATK